MPKHETTTKKELIGPALITYARSPRGAPVTGDLNQPKNGDRFAFNADDIVVAEGLYIPQGATLTVRSNVATLISYERFEKEE
jgi:hypothetical protein